MSKNFELLYKAQHGRTNPEPILELEKPRAPILHHDPGLRDAPQVPTVSAELIRAVIVLRKHWRTGAAFAAVVIMAVTVGTLLMKSVYEPVASLQIDPPGSEIFSIEGKGNADNSTEYITTQAKNLENDELLLEVLRKLRLDKVAEFGGANSSKAPASAESAGSDDLKLTAAENRALKELHKRIRVSHPAASRLLDVSVGSYDPVRAAEITNAVVEQFVNRDYMMRHDSIVQSSEWLQRQLSDIRTRMEESNRTLAAFQKENNLGVVSENQNTFSDQMSEVSRQLMLAEADRIQLQSYLNRFDGQTSGSLPQISGNPVVQNLTQKLAEVRAELSQSMAVYGENHPNVRKLKNQADQLQTELNAQRSSILNDLKTSYSAAQAREQIMKSEMASTTAKMALMTQYNALRKEADANTQLYNSLFAKIKEAGIAAESKSSPVRIVARARVLDAPTRPHRLVNIAVGIVVGLLGGVILVFLSEAFSTTIRTLEDIRQCVGNSSVTVIPAILPGDNASGKSGLSRLLPSRLTVSGDKPLFLLDRPNSPEAQALRSLYASLRFAQRSTLPQVIVIASPHSGEGKTTLSINLGAALAERGPTCLVDADLRKPGIAKALGLTSHRGLSDLLKGEASAEEIFYPVSAVPNLTVLPAGSAYEDVGKLISSDLLPEIVRELRSRFHFVLIDSPPVVPFADGRMLSVLADGVVLVGRSGLTTRSDLSQAVELLEEIGSAPILQTVLNAAEYPSVDYRYYHYPKKSTV